SGGEALDVLGDRPDRLVELNQRLLGVVDPREAVRRPLARPRRGDLQDADLLAEAPLLPLDGLEQARAARADRIQEPRERAGESVRFGDASGKIAVGESSG